VSDQSSIPGGSHELNSESMTPVYSKAQTSGQHENKRKLVAELTNAHQTVA
jgi:hypothetical protein